MTAFQSDAFQPEGFQGDFFQEVASLVPDVVGLEQAAAEEVLRAVGLQPVVVLVITTAAPAGQVTAQSPAAGAPLVEGAMVEITVSQYNVAEILAEHRNVRFKPLRRERKQAMEPQSEAVPSALVQTLVERVKPRSTGLRRIRLRSNGLGSIKPQIPPQEAPEIHIPVPQVVPLPPAVAPAEVLEEISTGDPAEPKATPPEIPTPAAAKSPKAVTTVEVAITPLDGQMAAFVEGVVAALTKRIIKLEQMLENRSRELERMQGEIDNLRKREINRARAEEIARQIAVDE